ncbi:hypothetical protein Tco_1390463, partial [Tanacetum coccineum]
MKFLSISSNLFKEDFKLKLEQFVQTKARDGENLDKMKEKGDACIFVGYSTQSRAYRNKTSARNRWRDVYVRTHSEDMADSAWIKAMQEELYQFDLLDVWELVDKPLCKNVINMK